MYGAEVERAKVERGHAVAAHVAVLDRAHELVLVHPVADARVLVAHDALEERVAEAETLFPLSPCLSTSRLSLWSHAFYGNRSDLY